MKKLLSLVLVLSLMLPGLASASESRCAPRAHCGMAHFGPAARTAMLKPYVLRLEELGGNYRVGMNRFEVMRAIFEIEKAL